MHEKHGKPVRGELKVQALVLPWGTAPGVGRNPVGECLGDFASFEIIDFKLGLSRRQFA